MSAPARAGGRPGGAVRGRARAAPLLGVRRAAPRGADLGDMPERRTATAATGVRDRRQRRSYRPWGTQRGTLSDTVRTAGVQTAGRPGAPPRKRAPSPSTQQNAHAPARAFSLLRRAREGAS